VDIDVLAPMQQMTKLPQPGAWRRSLCCRLLLAFRCAFLMCVVTHGVTPGRLMALLIQSRAHFEPSV
jgi:hypothetical protein